MRIFDKHPLPWEAAELPESRAVIVDAIGSFIAEFDSLLVAEWAISAMMLAQATDVDLADEEGEKP